MLTIAQILSVLVAGALLFGLLWRWPGPIAFFAIVSAALLDCLQVGTEGITLGINIYPGDVASAILLLVSFLVLLRYRKGISGSAIPCAILLALVGLNFVRGADVFGLKPARNSARNLFMFTVSAAAVIVLKPVFRFDAERLARWLGWAGGILSAIAIFRWAGVLSVPGTEGDGFREVLRALPSEYATVIGLAFIAVIYLQIVHRPTVWGWLAVAVFGVVTVFLQHRSVWMATAAGTVWLVVRTGRSAALRWYALATTGAAVIGLAALASPEIRQKVELLVVANVQETQSNKSTWAWRTQGYEEATDRLLASGAADMLLGPPSGWAAHSNGSFASMHIHNRYIDTLAYYGIVGFAVLLLWFGVLAKQVGRPAKRVQGWHSHDAVASMLPQALLLAEAVYFVAYCGNMLQGTILGLIAVAANQDKRSAKMLPVLRLCKKCTTAQAVVG